MKTTAYEPEDVRGKTRHILQGKDTDRATLAAIARQAMIERGLEPDFPPAAQQELAAIGGPGGATQGVRDVRDRLWASIDNDDSLGRDQGRAAGPEVGGGAAPVRPDWRAIRRHRYRRLPEGNVGAALPASGRSETGARVPRSRRGRPRPRQADPHRRRARFHRLRARLTSRTQQHSRPS